MHMKNFPKIRVKTIQFAKYKIFIKKHFRYLAKIIPKIMVLGRLHFHQVSSIFLYILFKLLNYL